MGVDLRGAAVEADRRRCAVPAEAERRVAAVHDQAPAALQRHRGGGRPQEQQVCAAAQLGDVGMTYNLRPADMSG